MLVLSRKAGQRILIGNDITILVQRINGNQVRIGIDAPRTTMILRSELLDRDQKLEAGPAVEAARP